MAYYAELNVYLDSSGSSSSNNRPKKVKQPKEKKVNSLKATAITAIALRSAVQTANFVNTKVGDYTGNKVMQSNISTALSVGSQLVGATLAGAKLGGGVGAIVGIGLATTKIFGSAILNESIERKNSIQEMNYKRAYTGSMTTSGSRWKGEKR